MEHVGVFGLCICNDYMVAVEVLNVNGYPLVIFPNLKNIWRFYGRGEADFRKK